jgi:hypothetical protein
LTKIVERLEYDLATYFCHDKSKRTKPNSSTN